jgi:hypothetical protein
VRDGARGFAEERRPFEPGGLPCQAGSSVERRTPEIGLLGVLHEKNRRANRVLTGLGVDRNRLRRDLLDALRGSG